MGNNKIYVAVPCLGQDDELESTVLSCLRSSSNMDDIVVGIACIGDIDFYNNIKSKFGEIKNIKITFFDDENNIGVAMGRHRATSMYSDEEYFLQIDSHMLFMRSWDVSLKNQLYEAQQISNNEKTILTGYAGKYKYLEYDGNFISNITSVFLTYNCWTVNGFITKNFVIPGWKNDIIKETFAPMPKISAHFIFGNQHFARNICLPKHIFFWEEEVIQSIELVSNGFTLVYPGPLSHILHLYRDSSIDGKGNRKSNSYYWEKNNISIDDASNIIETNFLNYIKDNPEKVKKYEEYIGFSILEGPKEENIEPKDFINKNYIPLIK